jgi:hypothetical protein
MAYRSYSDRNLKFPGKQIARSRPTCTTWPLRSADVTTRAYIKETVLRPPLATTRRNFMTKVSVAKVNLDLFHVRTQT